MKKIITFTAIFLLISVEWAVGQPWKTELDSVLNNGGQSTYGFGWFIEQQDASTSIYHLGEGDGFSVYFQRFPDQKRTMILNHAYPNRHALETYRLIRNIWEGKDYTLPTAQQRYNIDPVLFEDYVGSYHSNFGLVHVTAENGKLYLRPDPVPGKEELVPSSDSTFYFQHQNLEWHFYRDGEGKVIGFGIKGQPENMGTKQE